VEHNKESIIRRLANTIWQIFEKAEISNNAEGNWRVAEDIVNRIINGTYAPAEWRKFVSEEDMRALLEFRKQECRSE